MINSLVVYSIGDQITICDTCHFKLAYDIIYFISFQIELLSFYSYLQEESLATTQCSRVT